MSQNWVKDISEMHTHYGVNAAVRKLEPEQLKAFINFRLDFIQEELTEAYNAKSGDDLVDACIDIIVVALGTLDALDVEPDLAWDRVHACNMSKKVGIKESRPNPLNLPDLVKPEGWQPPFHGDNVGLLAKVYS